MKIIFLLTLISFIGIIYLLKSRKAVNPAKLNQEDKEMKKVSKPIAIVMALVLALGTLAVVSFATDKKPYAHPEDVFVLAGGHNDDTATLVAVGEMVYGSVEADGKAVYKLYSAKAQTLTISFESAAPINVTVNASGVEAALLNVTNQTKLSSNIDVENAYYYVTVENYKAPVVEEPSTDEPTSEEPSTEEPSTEETVIPNSAIVLNGGEDEEAAANEFFFATAVPGMETAVKVNANHSKAQVVAGQSLQLELSNLNIKNLNYFWRVLDDATTTLVDERDIVSVSKDGNVTVQPNSATFNKNTDVKVQAVMYYNGEPWTKTITITAVPANVFLEPYYDTTQDNCLTIGEGASRYITATTNMKDTKVTWSTEDAQIADVTSGGKVTGVGVGKTYIKASVKVGEVTVSRRILVDVKLNYVSVMGIAFDTHSDTVRVNDYKTVKYTFETAPADKNPTNAKVTFTSSDPAVATVDADGKVTGVSVGTATITVTSEDGKYSDTCTFTVQEPIPNWLMVIIAPIRMIYNLIMMLIGK